MKKRYIYKKSNDQTLGYFDNPDNEEEQII